MAFREIPPIQYDTDIERLMKYYQRSYVRVVKELIRLLETDSWNMLINQEASLARQISLIIREADKDILPELEDLLKKSHVAGQAQALLAIGDATTLAEATRGVAFTMFAQKSVEKMVTDTFEDVLALTDRTEKRIKQTVRDVAGEVMRMNAMNQMGLETTRKQVMEGLLKKGFSKKITKDFKGVTDSAGRKWELKKYVNMLVKTKMQQAYSEGVRAECVERGIDLAVVSSHGAKDACRHFEGMVISMTGATKGFLTYDELRRSNKIFHPNCEHTITPLRSLDLLPNNLQEKHREQLEKAKKGKIIS
jgi:Phage minor capsid protein 2